MIKKYVVVGASAGGISAAVRLRRLDEAAEITVFERSAHVDTAISGLAYVMGGVVCSNEALSGQSAQHFLTRYNIKVRLCCEVRAIDRYEKRISVYDEHTGKSSKYKYHKLILATGTLAKRPGIDGMDSPGIYTLKDPSDMLGIMQHIKDNKVRRAAVIGGGNIGLEAAENLSCCGIKTCVIEQRSHALPSFDGDMAQFARTALEDNGVALITHSSVLSIAPVDEGLRLSLTDQRAIIADIVILCTGTVPEVTLAKQAGLAIGVTGGILVDERQQTTDKDIYAVGDAVEVETLYGGKMLISRESSARRQARTAADNICGVFSKYKHQLCISILKLFDMTMASAGLTERQLRDREIKYEKVYTSGLSHAAYYPGAETIIVKLIFDKKLGNIYGAQIVGRDGVDKRIDVLATAMRAGMTVDKLADVELAYAPSFSNAKDVVNMAGYVASDVMNGLTQIVQWHDIKDMEDAMLLDVRTQAEHDAGTIAWSLHIPLDELRVRYTELPKDKEIIVFCHSGRRSYEAERLLRQKGYKVKNLTGGYSLYELFERKG